MKSEPHISAPSDHQRQLNVPHHHDFLVDEPLRSSGLAPANNRVSNKSIRLPKDICLSVERPCQRTLIVGTSETAIRLANELKSHFPNDFLVVGFASDSDDEESALLNPDGTPAGIPVLGAREELVELVSLHHIERVMFANCVDWQLDNTKFRARSPRDRRSQKPNGKQTVEPRRTVRERRREVADLYLWATSPSFFWPDARRARFYQFSKRSFDIALALGALTVSLPLALFIFPAIKVSSPGPIFYAQERVGQGGRTFTIYKLRTMPVDAERQSGPIISPQGDNRSTALGRLLRATKLDEVPQFWNVLKGEMTIVGPRPERPHFVEPFSGHIYSYALRHSVRPGLTGLAQIKGDHLTHVYVKLHYDLIYVCHRCFALDLSILARTPLTILRNLMTRP